MKSLTYASVLFLLGATLVIAADTASACGPPPSGTGITTCSGSAFGVAPDTDNGPVCVNTFCPGYHSNPSPGTCVSVWVNGSGSLNAFLTCVPVAPSPPDE